MIQLLSLLIHSKLFDFFLVITIKNFI